MLWEIGKDIVSELVKDLVWKIKIVFVEFYNVGIDFEIVEIKIVSLLIFLFELGVLLGEICIEIFSELFLVIWEVICCRGLDGSYDYDVL